MAAKRMLRALILACICLGIAKGAGHADTLSPASTIPYIFVAGPYGACTASDGSTTCLSTTSTTAVKTREVHCIRRGSFGLKLPDSFCSQYATKPGATMACVLPACVTATQSPQTIARAPITCQDGITAYDQRLHSANISINDGSGVAYSKMLFPNDFMFSVNVPVVTGPIVLNYALYKKGAATPFHSGERVGQAMTNNSYVLVEMKDLAQACDTQPKGKAVFAITMNQIKPPKPMSVDTNYFSRQKIMWFWPNSLADFPVESPDEMMSQGFPYTIKSAMSTKTPTYQFHSFIYDKNASRKESYPMFMDLRYLKD